jgi:formate dehydrogenase iron-sulfur subunit
VAAALWPNARGAAWAIELVRNGSRGLFWLEPLVEVATPQGRVAYGPVAPKTWSLCWTQACCTAAPMRCATA